MSVVRTSINNLTKANEYNNSIEQLNDYLKTNEDLAGQIETKKTSLNTETLRKIIKVKKELKEVKNKRAFKSSLNRISSDFTNTNFKKIYNYIAKSFSVLSIIFLSFYVPSWFSEVTTAPTSWMGWAFKGSTLFSLHKASATAVLSLNNIDMKSQNKTTQAFDLKEKFKTLTDRFCRLSKVGTLNNKIQNHKLAKITSIATISISLISVLYTTTLITFTSFSLFALGLVFATITKKLSNEINSTYKKITKIQAKNDFEANYELKSGVLFFNKI